MGLVARHLTYRPVWLVGFPARLQRTRVASIWLRWWVIPSRPNIGAEMAAFISLAESLVAAQDELEAVLQEADAAALCQL